MPILIPEIKGHNWDDLTLDLSQGSLCNLLEKHYFIGSAAKLIKAGHKRLVRSGRYLPTLRLIRKEPGRSDEATYSTIREILLLDSN